MNREEILAMEAGENLDRLVAVEVMNELMSDLSIPEDALELQLAGSPMKSGGGNWLCLCKYEEGDIPIWHPLPFSTGISAALQVMEKDGAWDIKKRFRPHPDDSAGTGGRATYQAKCFLSDYDPYENELINKRTGKSPWCWGLPEAICKAALIARLAG